MAIHDTVTATLAEMGLPASLLRTVLIRNSYFVGYKYRFEGGWATWLAETNVIEVCDEAGKMLKTVELEATEKETAA